VPIETPFWLLLGSPSNGRAVSGEQATGGMAANTAANFRRAQELFRDFEPPGLAGTSSARKGTPA
jgi:hypothetical protein